MTAAGMLLTVSLWCALSPRYEDGIVGKLFFAGMAISSYAILVSYPQEPSPLTQGVLVISTAAATMRELWLKRIWPFMRDQKGQ